MDNIAPCKVYTRNSLDTKLWLSNFRNRSEKSGIVDIVFKWTVVCSPKRSKVVVALAKSSKDLQPVRERTVSVQQTRKLTNKGQTNVDDSNDPWIEPFRACRRYSIKFSTNLNINHWLFIQAENQTTIFVVCSLKGSPHQLSCLQSFLDTYIECFSSIVYSLYVWHQLPQSVRGWLTREGSAASVFQ